MSTVRRTLVHVAVGVLVGAGPVAASPASAADDDRDLLAVLTGAQEVPGPGDPDGWGVAAVRVSPASGKICYTLFVRRIGTVTVAHIHVGKRGVAGDSKVVLTAPRHGFAAGCAQVSPARANKIADNPRGYYVNVHTSEFPAGAVRGQLRLRST
jgi:hypothetical protein